MKRICSLWLVVLFLVAGCRPSSAPVPGMQPATLPFDYPVSLDTIYWATPVYGATAFVAPDPPVGATGSPAPTLTAEALIQRGAKLYTGNCAPCHRGNGEGNLGRFPALNGNAFVTAQVPTPLIRTVLYGRGVMPAFAATLSDQETAAVLSYIRNSWGNDASVIHAAAVQQVEPVVRTTATPSVP
ncbi:MAG TPA: cytochrome c [Caldilineaceae bacterium]|nr:cytochrome c [Caldilineaceae bacterium]